MGLMMIISCSLYTVLVKKRKVNRKSIIDETVGRRRFAVFNRYCRCIGFKTAIYVS